MRDLVACVTSRPLIRRGYRWINCTKPKLLNIFIERRLDVLTLVPLKQRALALLQGAQSYRDVCDRHWTLCAGEAYFSPSAIYLEGQLEKVTQVAGTTTYAEEMRRLRGGYFQHPATEAYRLRNAFVLNGRVYKGPAKYTVADQREHLVSLGVARHTREVALASTLMGYRYFGHWMIDDLPLTLAAREIAEPVTTNRQLSVQQIEYSNILDARATPVDRIRCDSMVIIDDRSQNKYKRERIEQLRSRFRRSAPKEPKVGVMLLRGASGVKRLLVNEGDVASYFADLGYAIIDPLRVSADEVIRECSGAKVVVGVTGSQLMPGFLAAAERSTIFLIQPPFYFENCYKDYGDSLGIQHAFVVGDQVAESAFRINLDDIRRTLEKISIS